VDPARNNKGGELGCNSKEQHKFGFRERYKGARAIVPIVNKAKTIEKYGGLVTFLIQIFEAIIVSGKASGNILWAKL
jgi:hypothetical protein